MSKSRFGLGVRWLLVAQLNLSFCAIAAAATVNWIDPAGYTKPEAIDLAMPSEGVTSNRYYVDLQNGSGTTCSQVSPCGSVANVAGKPGTTGGPAYIYIKGTGPIGSPTLYGSVGKEVVIKPWDDATQATITGRNNWAQRLQYVIFDGGPNLRIKFSNNSGGQFDPSVYFNASTAGTHSNITFYRTQWHVPGSGEWISVWGTIDNLRIINSEFYATGSTDGTSQHHIYPSLGSNYGPMTGFEIRNSIFRDTPGEVIELRVVSQSVSGVVIDGNVFHNIGKGTCSSSFKCRSAITLAQEGGSIGSVRISNNLMWDLGEGAVRCWGGNAQIYNNTIHKWGQGKPQNGSYGTWAFFGYSKDGSCTVKNNIIYGGGTAPNGSTLIPFDSSPNINSQASNNICPSGQSCGTSKLDFGSNTLVSIDQNSAGFLTLSPDSAALSGGANLYSLAVTTDFAGQARPSSGAFSISAFQSVLGDVSAPAPSAPTGLLAK